VSWLAPESEAAYYREMFDKKTNTIKQIWKNLNSVLKALEPKKCH